MIKKYEKQLENKTVSIKKIYEWLNDFLSAISLKFKNGGKLTKKFESIVNKEFNDCKKEYSNYISLEKNILKLAHKRKKICEQLNKSNEQVAKLVLDCKIICSGNNISKIADFRRVNNKKLNIKEIETILNSPSFSDEDFAEFKNLYTSGNPNLMRLCNIYDNSKGLLRKDLERIEKEGKVKSIASAIIKKKDLEKNNKEILIKYHKKVVPFLDEKLDKFKKVLSDNGMDPQGMKDIQAIEKMITCWKSDYNLEKIEKAYTNANYCRNLGLKLSKLCNNYGISMTNDIPTLFMQLSTRLTMMLKDFNSKNVAFHKDSRNRISKWIEDFQQKYVEITKNFSEVRPVQSGNQKIIFPVDIVGFSNKIRNLSNQVESFSNELNSQFGEELQTISMQFTKICPSH